MLRILLLLLALASPALGQGLLPNGQQTFVDVNGQPLAGGSVYFYVPGTTTARTTWSDQGLATPNANPVVLDAAGRATVWGTGLYREMVYDVNGNLVWDKVTSGQGFPPVNARITGSTAISHCTGVYPVVVGASPTITLPTSPGVGETCMIADAGNNAGTYPFTVTAGTAFLSNGAHSATLGSNGQILTLTWLGTPAVWLVNYSNLNFFYLNEYAQDTGATNALAVTLSPAPSGYSDLLGAPLRIKLAHTNTSGTVTLNVNGLGAQSVVYQHQNVGAFLPGVMVANSVYEFVWDGANFEAMGLEPPATTAQVQAGTDNVFKASSSAIAGAFAGTVFSSNTPPQSSYQKFPDGSILQCGKVNSATGNNDSVSLPTAFPTGYTLTLLSSPAGGGTVQTLVNGSTTSLTQFNIYTWAFNSTTHDWDVTAGIGVGWCAWGN